MRINRWIFAILVCIFVSSCEQPKTQESTPDNSSLPTPLPRVEGLNEIKEMNIRQQAVYINQSKFLSTVEDVAIGVGEDTENYKYRIIPQGNNQGVIQIAEAKKPGQTSYIGIIFAVKDPSNTPTSIAQICETNQPLKPDIKVDKIPQSATDNINCPKGTTIVPPSKYLAF
jgi:hypothetical protein